MLGTQLQAALENAKPSPAQEQLSRIFSDIGTSLKTTFQPLAEEIANFILPLLDGFGRVVSALESVGLLSGFLKVAIVGLIGNMTIQTGAVLANTAAMIAGSISDAVGFAGIFGMSGLFLSILPAIAPILLGLGIVALLSALTSSTEKLATAEELRAKADLRGIDDNEKALSRFEAVTAALIGDFIQSQSMANSIAVASTDAQIERLDTLAAIFDSKIDELIGTEGGVTFA